MLNIPRIAILLLTLVLLSPVMSIGAHADLLRAEPAPDALLAAPPRTLDLWLTEPVAEGEGSPTIRLLDQSGSEIAVTGLAVDSDDQTHVSASVRNLGTGTFTVVWSNRSATDGHTISGSYAFRVASSTRAPGAATTEGDNPAAWAVVTRWLTFLGAALVAGGFAIGRLVLAPVESDDSRRRRGLLMTIGAGVALLATLAEPILHTIWPPGGTLAPSLVDAVRTLPDPWLFRPAALLTALLAAHLSWRLAKSGHAAPANLDRIGTTAGLVALLGLSLTSHAAGRADWRAIAVASNILHQWAIALWVGGLVALALWWSSRDPETDSAPVRRFSRLALGLAVVGIGTGVVNAGFVLPKLQSLWSSSYGDILLIKIAVIVPVLLLATFHRTLLRRTVDRLSPTFRRSLRLETALAILVILGGSVLALLAPPSVRVARADRPVELNIRQPILAEVPGQETWVHLIANPAKAGPNTFAIALRNGDGTPAAVEPPQLVRLTFSSLDQSIAGTPVEATPNPDGTFTTTSSNLSLDGWWSIDVTLRWAGKEDTVLTYYLILPDPNLNGLDAPVTRETDPAAAALYEQAMAKYTATHRVRYRQLMADPRGQGVVSEHVVNDGSDGSRAGYHYQNISVNGWEAVVFADQMWTRYPGEPWEESAGQAMIPPSRWGEEYTGATGFHLGRIEEIDGEPCQVITFVVPDAPNRVVAWYVWWVGTESGLVRRDTMISRSHYMINNLSDFDAPLVVAPPTS